MTFARFLNVDLAGKTAVACGSDSFLPIDGRLNLYNAKAKAEGQIFRLALVARFEAMREALRDLLAIAISRGESIGLDDGGPVLDKARAALALADGKGEA